MKSMKAITAEYRQEIEKAFDQNRAGAWDVKAYLEHSSVAYHGRCVMTLQIPKVFAETDIAVFENLTDTLYRIFEKVIRAYRKDPDYRALFPFSRELEELILLPAQCEPELPIARFDIFYDEETRDFKFCEINTDGTSAMNEDYVLNSAFELNPAHRIMQERYDMQPFELYDSWVSRFLAIYQTYEKHKEHPYIAIVDFLAGGSITEFEEFQCRFEAAGYETEICEITELVYRDHVLYSPSGHPVDVIYRRAVTSDVMAHYDDVTDFLEAVRRDDVCIIGSFTTQILHNKWLFHVLCRPETAAFLTEEETAFLRHHIPHTELLSKKTDILRVITENKDAWLIKPLDSYGSRGVYAGVDCTQDEWEEKVNRYADSGYLCQEYVTPYGSDNIYMPDPEPAFRSYTNMTGLFVYGGEFAGIYSRLSDGGIISSQYNEKAVPSLVLRKS